MLPHVKRLRKEFQSLCRQGVITAADCCAKCSRSSAEVFQLELHHIIPIRDAPDDYSFNPNTQENIVTLCTDCHKAYHACYEPMSFMEYLKQVPLMEAYAKLKDYRDEKQRRRQEHINKHRGRRKPPLFLCL